MASPDWRCEVLALEVERTFWEKAAILHTEASLRVGYESPSQFGREYRRMFGAPPRQDVAALRLDAAVAP